MKFEKRWLNAQEVADHLGFKLQTVYRQIARGIIPASKIGRSVRIDSNELEAFLANSRIARGK
jgi:excisionase family DNA binding protein